MDRDILNDVVAHFRGLENPTQKEKELLAEIEKHEIPRFPIAYVDRKTIGGDAEYWDDESMREFAGIMGDSYCGSSQYFVDLECAKEDF